MDISDRLRQLHQMHNIMLSVSQEDMRLDWTLFIGNTPDFNVIAEDDGYYNECIILFSDLVTDIGYWH